MNYIKYFLTVIFVSNFLFAQNGGTVSFPDARTVAMGSQTAITSAGLYSILGNPANLANQKATVEVSTILPIPSINIASSNNFLSFNEIDYYFGGVNDGKGNRIGRYLNTAEKGTLLSHFNDGAVIQTNTTINLFSISVSAGKEVGNFGFSINDIIGQRTGLPKGLIDLILFGNEIEKIYDLSDFYLSTSYLREYDFSYARDFSSLTKNFFNSFSAGITLKLVQGFAYTNIESMDLSVKTLADHSILVKNNFKTNIALSPDFGVEWDWDNTKKTQNISPPFLEPAGTGFGLNFGFAAQVDDVWGVALSITDIGSVTWDVAPVSYSANGSFLVNSLTDSTMTDSLTAALEPEGNYSSSFTSALPTVLRLGISFRLDKFVKGRFPGEMLFVFGYNQGFNETVYNTKTALVSLGFEWKPIEQLPIRSGIAFGGFNKFGWSLGMGLNFSSIEVNIASADIISVLQGNDTRLVQFTFGSKWKF